jgi:hypothetical protein
MSINQQRQDSQRRSCPRTGEGTRRPVGGGGAARKRPHMPASGGYAPASKIYSQARVEHASARGDRMSGSLVAGEGGDGQEP